MDNPFSITVNNLSKKFGNFVAVNDISFNVAKGEIFGFLGPNGAGKTTTIRMLCGILDPSSGTGTVASHDIVKEQEMIKRSIGYMSQKFSLYYDLTVEENLDFFGGIYGIDRSIREKRKIEILKMAELLDRKHLLVESLPIGIKQRLALGCAILHNPKVLFLDEPTAGVDPISRKNFWDIIKELSSKGTTILVTSHYMDEVEQCGRIALISEGRIKALGTVDQLKDNYMDKSVIEIECLEPMKPLEALRQPPLSYDVALYGLGIHITADDAEKEIAKISEFLRHNNFEFSSIRKVRPSLEDVFVDLTDKRGK